MPVVELAASFFPEIKGWLEGIFILLLVLLAGVVGLFTLFLLVNQFRNPGRRPARRP